MAKFNKRNNSDLWKYFYWDFFHDGSIEKIVLWGNPGDIIFHILCPNIKRRKGEKFEYINVNFKCTFRDVAYFSFDHDDPKDLIETQRYPMEFMGSEINTLSDLIESKKVIDDDGDIDTEFHSLILELGGNNTLFYLEMVFSQVDVLAKENTAYELMLASDDFYVPIYREDEDVDKLPEWISKPAGTIYIPDEDDDS